MDKRDTISKDTETVVDYFLRTTGVTMCPPRKARSRSGWSWNRLNDRDRAARGLAHD